MQSWFFNKTFVSAVDAVQPEPDEVREAAEGSAAVVVVLCSDAREQGEGWKNKCSEEQDVFPYVDSEPRHLIVTSEQTEPDTADTKTGPEVSSPSLFTRFISAHHFFTWH